MGSLSWTRIVLLLEAEDFLELVDHQQQVFVRAASLSGMSQKCACALAQSFGRAVRICVKGFTQRGGESVDWFGPRSKHSNAPPRTGTREVPDVQLMNEARTYQRGLTRPRQTHHGDEPMVSQPDEQVINLLIATEERLVLLPLVRPEARVGIVLMSGS